MFIFITNHPIVPIKTKLMCCDIWGYHDINLPSTYLFTGYLLEQLIYYKIEPKQHMGRIIHCTGHKEIVEYEIRERLLVMAGKDVTSQSTYFNLIEIKHIGNFPIKLWKGKMLGNKYISCRQIYILNKGGGKQDIRDIISNIWRGLWMHLKASNVLGKKKQRKGRSWLYYWHFIVIQMCGNHRNIDIVLTGLFACHLPSFTWRISSLVYIHNPYLGEGGWWMVGNILPLIFFPNTLFVCINFLFYFYFLKHVFNYKK